MPGGLAAPPADQASRAEIMSTTEETVPAGERPQAGAKVKGPKKVKKDQPPRKRGPPRPHRKLAQDVLEGRIGKLKKRIERARGQLEDAERHIEGYDKEAKYREQEKKDGGPSGAAASPAR